MKLSKIAINNFRQYYGTINIDLSTNDEENIIVVGGRNGYGKTNLLLSIVWCLYGDKLSQIDDNFKKEIQKEKNYSSFMRQSINWTAHREQKDAFSVSIEIIDVEVPDINILNIGSKGVIVSRSFNVSRMSEHLSILDIATGIEMFDDEDDKINFINDYLIPIDAAKFVFFDAEKISEIANLSIKDEGSFINDALSKILGLDIYDTLIEDMNLYINTLKKEGASKNIQEQILDKEKSISMYEIDIERLEEDNAEIQKRIYDLKKNIREYDILISQYSRQGNILFNREDLLIDIEALKREKDILSNRFNDLSEVIPLVILTGKLEEVKSHLEKQSANEFLNMSFKDNEDKIDRFIDSLFNEPPKPDNSSMSFSEKAFYYEKAKRLSFELFESVDSYEVLEFEHDLNISDKALILDAVDIVNVQSKEMFGDTISEFNRVQLELSELTKTLNKVDADLEDELITEYISKKKDTEYEISDKYIKTGENDQKILNLKENVGKLNQQLISLMRRVEVNSYNSRKIEESNKYISVLNLFLEEQKKKHKESLEKTILSELNNLLHKLNFKVGGNSKLITDVKVTILAAGQGMKVSLLDEYNNEIRKESLSSGEKQIYISCLIKAILKESIQDLPIFIDTPLGRLDEEHRDSLVMQYYPNLSKQVVLFSTNSEITPKRHRDISNHIAKSYLLVNDGSNTYVKNGYFNSVSND